VKTDSNPPSRKRVIFVRILRWIAAVVLAFYATIALALVALRWATPPTTGRADSAPDRRAVPQAQVPEAIHVRSARPHRAGVCSAPSSPPRMAASNQHHGIDWQEVDKLVEKDLDNGRLGRGAPPSPTTS